MVKELIDALDILCETQRVYINERGSANESLMTCIKRTTDAIIELGGKGVSDVDMCKRVMAICNRGEIGSGLI